MSIYRIALTTTLAAGCLVALLPGTATARPAAPARASNPRSLCAPPADTVGPTADSVTFGRSSLDLDSGSRTQTVTVDASDTSGSGTPSGVASVQIYIGGHRFFSSPKLTLVSGTADSGTWQGTFTVSKYAHPGTYTINDLYVTDAARNQQEYPGYSTVPQGPNALSLHPADDPSFTVTGTPARRPKAEPAGTLRTFALSPSHVDTTSSSRRVHVAARFSGAAPSTVVVELDSANKSRRARFVFLRARLHRHGHRWTGSIRVPRWLGNQTLQSSLEAGFPRTLRPRSRSYDSDRLARLHATAGVKVVSGVDHTAPKLTSVTLTPDPIDSTTGPERVTVTATATDTGSGVRSVVIEGGIRHGANGVASGSYPFASAGVGYLSSQDFRVRLSKTAQGTWVGTTTVRQCVPSGTYKLSAQLSDVAGNDRYDSTTQLARAGITSTVDVTSTHGDIAPPYVYSAATYGAANEVFLNFSEGVTNVSTSTLTVYALSPQGTRFQSPTTVASIICSNGHATIPCDGTAGLVTSAVLTIPGMSAGHKYEVYANQDQVVPQLTDGNRNPLDWNYDATEVLDS